MFWKQLLHETIERLLRIHQLFDNQQDALDFDDEEHELFQNNVACKHE